jgi:hypothetical protein
LPTGLDGEHLLFEVIEAAGVARVPARIGGDLDVPPGAAVLSTPENTATGAEACTVVPVRSATPLAVVLKVRRRSRG